VDVDKCNKKIGICAIVRDSMVEVLATLSALKDYILKPVVAEAMTALRAVVFSRELGMQKVELESDSLQLGGGPDGDAVERLKEFEHVWPSLIEDARGAMNCLQKWKASHVR
jgi:hypothetical protein